jgi:hypothetical protein
VVGTVSTGFVVAGSVGFTVGSTGFFSQPETTSMARISANTIILFILIFSFLQNSHHRKGSEARCLSCQDHKYAP